MERTVHLTKRRTLNAEYIRTCDNSMHHCWSIEGMTSAVENVTCKECKDKYLKKD